MGFFWKISVLLSPEATIRDTIIDIARMRDELYGGFSEKYKNLTIQFTHLNLTVNQRPYLAHVIIYKTDGTKTRVVFDNVKSVFESGLWVNDIEKLYTHCKRTYHKTKYADWPE